MSNNTVFLCGNIFLVFLRSLRIQIFAVLLIIGEILTGCSGIGRTLGTSSVSNGNIAFVSERNGVQEIYLMNSDGSNQKRLTSDMFSNFQPSWSPDGKNIAFVSERDDNREIYIMRADGTNQTRMTYNNGDDESPTWSPDGKYLAFASSPDLNPAHFEIKLIQISSKKLTSLTNNMVIDYHPVWLSYNKSIDYESGAHDSRSNYIMDYDGMHQRQDKIFPFLANNISLSPDKKTIAFDSNHDDKLCVVTCLRSIFLINTDGTNLRRITDTLADRSYPTWSPDGKSIVFQQSGYDCVFLCLNKIAYTDIYTINISNGITQRITKDSLIDSEPSWSPH